MTIVETKIDINKNKDHSDNHNSSNDKNNTIIAKIALYKKHL